MDLAVPHCSSTAGQTQLQAWTSVCWHVQGASFRSQFLQYAADLHKLGAPAAQALEQGACVGRQLGPEVRNDGEAVLLVGPLGPCSRGSTQTPSTSVYRAFVCGW